MDPRNKVKVRDAYNISHPSCTNLTLGRLTSGILLQTTKRQNLLGGERGGLMPFFEVAAASRVGAS